MTTRHSCSSRSQDGTDARPLSANVSRGRTSLTNSRASRRRNSCRHVVGSKATTDPYVVRQAIAGDPIAQEQLFKSNAGPLYGKAFAILRNREDAQDAVQDGCFRAYSNIHSFEGRSSFSTWLTQIVINSALMILRKNRSRREASTDDSGVASFIQEIRDRSRYPEQTFLESERKATLDETIGGLSPRLRMTVEFGPIQGLSTKEAAQRLGISALAAKSRLFHARAALRKSVALRAVA